MERNAGSSEHLYQQFHVRLKHFILRRIPDKADAEDLLQEVFLRIHARIGTLKDSSRIESWIFQIARNLIIDHYRSKRTREEIDEEGLPDEGERTLTAVERLAPAIRELVDQLPQPYREALVLTEFEGMSQKELAQQLGISLSGAKSRVQRGRAMIKDSLMRCCHFEFDRYGTVIDYHAISCCCCREPSAQR
ncbi:MAG: RNA polymerase sigma factor SigZ [Ignavibacteria bacterium]|nr:RNA polymerase sigma factor SigZ [Ignavibacteria bacterium]